jgi:anti-sigma-K factor RskA
LDPKERQEEIQALAALFALGALNERETRAFEADLRDSESAAGEILADFESIVTAIGLSVREMPPPDSIRKRLLSRIEERGEG